MTEPPKFFSLAFHLKFFPGVLWGIYRRRREQEKEYQSPFAHHFLPEIPIIILVCLLLIAVGLPRFVMKHSLGGGAAAALGFVGLAALFVRSVWSEAGARRETGGGYTFDAFVPTIFFFFVLLGATAGWSWGFIEHSPRLAILGGLAGLAAGYAAGIAAGLWVNYLGWIAIYFVYLAFAAMMGMAILDAVLLYVLFFSG